MMKIGKIFISLLLGLAVFGLYVAYLPTYVCMGLIFTAQSPSQSSPIEICIDGEVGPTKDLAIDDFLLQLEKAKHSSLESMLSESRNAKSIGLEKYREMIISNFSSAIDLKPSLTLKIGNKELFLVPKAGTNEKLALIVESRGRGEYRYYDTFGDRFWDGVLAALSLRDIEYTEFVDFLYPLAHLGYLESSRLPDSMGGCCIARLSKLSEFIEGNFLKNTEQYKIYESFIYGVNNRNIPRDVFSDDREWQMIMSSLESEPEKSVAYWDLGDAVRMYRSRDSSILILKNGKEKNVVKFVGERGGETIYEIAMRNNIDNLIDLGYVDL